MHEVRICDQGTKSRLGLFGICGTMIELEVRSFVLFLNPVHLTFILRLFISIIIYSFGTV